MATLAWGSSFLILKNTIEHVPGFFVIAIRFLFATLVMFIIFFKKIISINKQTLICGIVLGLSTAVAYLVQTWGLKYTTPARNAFLTSTYCVMCPFMYWLLYRLKPTRYNVFAAITCITGVGMISLLGGDGGTGENVLLGDGLTLLCGVFYSLQIIFIDKFQKDGIDPMSLLTIEFLVVGVVLGISWAVFELPVSGLSAITNIDGSQWFSIIYLTIVCTLFAQFAQIMGQRFANPNQSAIILSLEAVFGAMFSVIFGTEKLTVFLVIGFVLTFSSILINEYKLDPIKIFCKNSKKE
jgi:drug/metabolite transporter (DMT)-like permease